MLNWIESRTGFVSMTKEFLTEDVPGGASYWYVFGSATLFAMIVQIVTGIFLTFFYAPSAATAWESTRAIYLNPFTHLLLSIHYWGASAMIALVFLHLLQVLIWGAYKSPRELQWVVGVLLLLVTLVLGLTGYLLAVGHGRVLRIASLAQHRGRSRPCGPILQHDRARRRQHGHRHDQSLLRPARVADARACSSRSSARILAIFRHNGAAGPVADDPRKLKPGRFWPDQMFMDGAFSLVRVRHHHLPRALRAAVPRCESRPDELAFVPYPAWYFLSLFGLLALVPPEIQLGRLYDQHGTHRDDRRADASSCSSSCCFRGSTAARRAALPRAPAFSG